MLKELINSCQDLIFPSYCLHCEQQLLNNEPPLLCDACIQEVGFINSPRCTCCGMPFETGNDHLCGQCLQKKYSFDLARAAVYYQLPVSTLISSLKFNGSLAGLSTLSHLATTSSGLKELSEPDIILPVPLHTKRLRQRQFNQALLLGQAIFPDKKKIIHPSIFIRHRPTSPQTGLSGKERRRNLTGAFSVRDLQAIQDKQILLIDDVFTTGQTVHECAKVLRKAGVKRIEVFTLARALII